MKNTHKRRKGKFEIFLLIVNEVACTLLAVTQILVVNGTIYIISRVSKFVIMCSRQALTIDGQCDH